MLRTDPAGRRRVSFSSTRIKKVAEQRVQQSQEPALNTGERNAASDVWQGRVQRPEPGVQEPEPGPRRQDPLMWQQAALPGFQVMQKGQTGAHLARQVGGPHPSAESAGTPPHTPS